MEKVMTADWTNEQEFQQLLQAIRFPGTLKVVSVNGTHQTLEQADHILKVLKGELRTTQQFHIADEKESPEFSLGNGLLFEGDSKVIRDTRLAIKGNNGKAATVLACSFSKNRNPPSFPWPKKIFQDRWTRQKDRISIHVEELLDVCGPCRWLTLHAEPLTSIAIDRPAGAATIIIAKGCECWVEWNPYLPPQFGGLIKENDTGANVEFVNYVVTPAGPGKATFIPPGYYYRIFGGRKEFSLSLIEFEPDGGP